MRVNVPFSEEMIKILIKKETEKIVRQLFIDKYGEYIRTEVCRILQEQFHENVNLTIISRTLKEVISEELRKYSIRDLQGYLKRLEALK